MTSPGPLVFLGLGSIGQRHLRNVRSILGWSIEVIAVREHRKAPLLNEVREIVPGETIEEKYSITTCSCLEEAIDRQPAAIFVCNPSSKHFQVLAEALTAEIPTFVEKPVVTNLDDLGQLEKLSLSANTSASCMVGYQLRFHPGLTKIKQWLDRGKIGRVIYAQIHHGEYLPNFHPYEDYRPLYASREELGGGVVLTQTHEIDYALWLLGAPESVGCVGGKSSDLEIDVEDHALISLSCHGPLGSIPVSIALDYLRNPAQRGCQIIGEEGVISIDFNGQKNATLVNWKRGLNENLKFDDLQLNELFKREIQVFLSGKPIKEQGGADLTDGVISARVGLLAKKSMKNKGARYRVK